tara:strand:+ start:633 stop:1571 length:939 start_codon:yes stop_codon:yes gene_type:complete
MAKKMAVASWWGTTKPSRYNLHKSSHSQVLQEKYGYEISSIEMQGQPYEVYYNSFKDADIVLINNGFKSNIINAGNASRDLGKNIIYTEHGVMPQRPYVSLDDKGLFCTHSLCSDLSWINDQHIEDYKNYIKQSKYHPYVKYKDEKSNIILCCLQVSDDAQLTYCTSLNNIYLIDKCFNLYPDKNIVIRFHPKMSQRDSLYTLNYIKKIYSGRQYKLIHSSAAKKIAFLSQAASAGIIFGLNSTVLIESLIIGKKVVALADCPIKNQLLDTNLTDDEYENRKLKLLAGYFASQYKRGDVAGAERALERFSFL